MTIIQFCCCMIKEAKNKTYLNYNLMMMTNILYMIFIKSSRLSGPCVSITWLPLVLSWSLWNYILTNIFIHFNCSISTTISLNLVSKGHLTTSQLMHWLQTVTSHHLNQCCIYMRQSTSLVYIVDWLFMFGPKPFKENVDSNISEKNWGIYESKTCTILFFKIKITLKFCH